MSDEKNENGKISTKITGTINGRSFDAYGNPGTCIEIPFSAVKFDQGKPDLSHISLNLIEEIAKVREFGARKYSRANWRKGFKYNRSIAAALRHIFAFNEGQDNDPESGLLHISHALCCLEHLLNDIKNHPENDDRDNKSKIMDHSQDGL